jgi:hypothetical protein
MRDSTQDKTATNGTTEQSDEAPAEELIDTQELVSQRVNRKVPETNVIGRGRLITAGGEGGTS